MNVLDPIAVKQWAITTAGVDPVLCHNMVSVSLVHNGLTILQAVCIKKKVQTIIE